MNAIQKLDGLFAPRSIAIVGASDVSHKVGSIIARNLIEHGYAGHIFFVNSSRDVVLGQRCYPAISDVPEQIDCAVIAVPGEFVYEVINASKEKCKNYIVISAGFGETGIAGHNREMQLNELASAYDLTILGPNCLGFILPQINLNASFAAGMPARGSIALISQSGALAVAAMDRAEEMHIGFSAIVSIGNEMMVHTSHVIRYFDRDVNTRTIVVYVEGIREGGDAFIEAISHATEKGKTVIVLKSGRTAPAQKAIALHTGSLAGDDEIFRAAVTKAGGVCVDSMEELFVAMAFVARFDLPLKDRMRIGVITNAGGPGVLLADTVASLDHMEMSVIMQKTKKRLFDLLPRAASVHNPIDLLGDADVVRYETSIRALYEDRNVDMIVVLLTPQAQTPIEKIARSLIDLQKEQKKPVVVSFIGGMRVAAAIMLMQKNGVVHYTSVQSALCTLNKLFISHERYAYPHVRKNIRVRQSATQQIIRSVKSRTVLYYEECVQVAKIYNIPISPFVDITSGLSAQQRIIYPCVIKIDDPHVSHKTDRGGVIMPIRTLTELYRARVHLRRMFPSRHARVIVQPLSPIKMELLIGMKRDPIFGVVVVAGLGGIYTEVMRKVQFFVAPLSLHEIKELLMSGTLGFLFVRTRGQHAYHLDTVARCILQISLIGVENADVLAIDINPFLVYNDDRADVAVDFKVIIKKVKHNYELAK